MIRGNHAAWKGGAIYFEGLGAALIAGCVITDNSAGDGGGGIYFNGQYEQYNTGDPLVRDCLITCNSAGKAGGGVLVIGGNGERTVFVETCTIATNHSVTPGGGVRVGAGGALRLANSILWSNVCTVMGDQLSLYYAEVSVSYSDVEGGQGLAHVDAGAALHWLEGNLVADPLFVDPAAGDHHLTPGSPCVDAGDPAFAAALGQTDVDGDSRVTGGAVDIGADELAPGQG